MRRAACCSKKWTDRRRHSTRWRRSSPRPVLSPGRWDSRRRSDARRPGRKAECRKTATQVRKAEAEGGRRGRKGGKGGRRRRVEYSGRVKRAPPNPLSCPFFPPARRFLPFPPVLPYWGVTSDFHFVLADPSANESRSKNLSAYRRFQCLMRRYT